MTQEAHIIWLLSGLLGLGLGLFVGELSLLALAIAALITAIVAITVPSVTVQFILWGLLSLCLAIVLRGFEPQPSKILEHAKEARVCDPILPGQHGYVRYEGSTWRAQCQISDITIPADEIVHVVGCQGNTLIVLPTRYLNPPPADVFSSPASPVHDRLL